MLKVPLPEPVAEAWHIWNSQFNVSQDRLRLSHRQRLRWILEIDRKENISLFHLWQHDDRWAELPHVAIEAEASCVETSLRCWRIVEVLKDRWGVGARTFKSQIWFKVNLSNSNVLLQLSFHTLWLYKMTCSSFLFVAMMTTQFFLFEPQKFFFLPQCTQTIYLMPNITSEPLRGSENVALYRQEWTVSRGNATFNSSQIYSTLRHKKQIKIVVGKNSFIAS